MHIRTTKKGFGIVEIVVGSAVIAGVLYAAVSSVISIRELERTTTHIIRANYLLLETVDVVRIFRDDSWSVNVASLTLDSPYYLEWDSTSWSTSTTESVIDGTFYRTATLSSVNRDVNDNIVTSGGSLDAGTLKVVAEISWLEKNGTTTKAFETYITDLYGN